MYEYLSKEGVKTLLNNITAKWLRYDNSESGLAATTVQEALDELKSLIQSGGGSIDPETPSEPEVEKPPILSIVGKTEAEIEAMAGTDGTLTINGVEWYVLDVMNKTVYASSTGGSSTTNKAALLWAKEPLNNAGYTFGKSRTGVSNSRWAGSLLQQTLEDYANTNSMLAELSLRVDTTVAPYSGNAANSYDKLFVLSVEECDAYGVSGSNKGYDAGGKIDDGAGRWLRTPYTDAIVYALNANTGVCTAGTNDYAKSLGVRPAMWVSLGDSNGATVSEVKYAAALQDMGIESISGESDFAALVDMGITVN